MKKNNSQQFKGDKLSLLKCVNSVTRFYNAASAAEINEGLQWYNEANIYTKELAVRFNLPVSVIAGIIAVFSPQAGWIENKRYTLTFLLNRSTRLRSEIQQEKANKIIRLKSEDSIFNALSISDAAWKTKAFFLNILNPDVITDVTIDRHAIAACIQHTSNVHSLEDRYGKLTKKQYDFFQKVYVIAAEKLDILPHELQAIVWVTYRRLRDLKSHEGSLKHWAPFVTDVTF